ncbi:MAG TPA: protease pro-enzyme activation domain-containing protein [Acidimicrobiia bacterium]|nr:protease pro-enzyme activation domain-containing protein [Acidimicrobiia bacterium]
MTRSKTRAIVLIALAMGAAALPTRATAGSSASASRPARFAPRIPKGATALGQLPDQTQLTFDVVLSPSNPSGLQTLLDGQRDPASPWYQRYLGRGQFLQRFGPGAEQVDSVVAWLHGAGLADTTVDGFAVKVRAGAGAISRALGISMERYRTPDNHETFSTREAPLVPDSISGRVSAILGLTDVAAATPRLDHSPAAVPASARRAVPHADGLTPCAGATTKAGTAFWTPDQVGALYGVGNLLDRGQTGTGKTIALVELSPHSNANTTAYKTCFGLTNPVATVIVDSGGSADPNGTLEANIDIEEAATQAPGATVVSYEGPNTETGEFDVYQRIVDDNTAQAVSTSWGLCEPNMRLTAMAAISTLLAQAAAQGQTVVAASGDNGAEDCFGAGNGSPILAVDSPADDPNITGVGGTYLLGAGNEPVWNDCQGKISYAQCTTDLGGAGGGGGGGLSQQFLRPSWQPLAAASTCATCRQVPDVSANAGVGEVFRSGGVWVAVGGTSIAAPKIAAIVADVNTACTARVGDLAPKLVTLAAGHGYGTALKDVTTGDNDLSRTHGGSFPAATGFDLASGTGVPIAAGWSCPEVESLSSTTGAAGASVTITGFALADASIKFGAVTATVTAQDATSVTVTVPFGAGNVAVRGTNAIGSGTRTVNFSYPGAATTTTTSTTSTTAPHTTTTTAPTRPRQPPVKIAAPVNTRAYRMVASDGGIFDFGGAAFYGSTGAIHLNRPIVAMATDRATGGYWFVASDGGVFGFHAPFLGSTADIALPAPVVGMAARATGKGYWLVTSNGSVFAFGDAPNFGSVPQPRAPIAGIAATADGKGYWLAGIDGSIYNFGDAHNFGSMSGTRLAQPIVGISADLATGGYWMVATDGGIFGFHAPFFGSTGAIRLNQPIVGIAATRNGKGYWMVARDGGIFSFANAGFSGSMGGSHLNQPIVGMAAAP